MNLSNKIIQVDFANKEIILLFKKKLYNVLFPVLISGNTSSFVFFTKDIKKILKDSKFECSLVEKFKYYDFLLINLSEEINHTNELNDIYYNINLSMRTVEINNIGNFFIYYPFSIDENLTFFKNKNIILLEHTFYSFIFKPFQKDVLCEYNNISIRAFNQYLKDRKTP